MPPTRPPPTYLRILVLFLLVFFLAATILCAAAGAYLAGTPARGQSVFTRQQGFVPGGTLAQAVTGTNVFIRAPDGSIHLGVPIGATGSWTPPPGDNLGSAEFELSQVMTGSPATHRTSWAISVWNIQPAPGGPPAADARAWRAIVAAAFSSGQGGMRGPPPRALLRGEPTGSIFRPCMFASNAIARLRRAPLWPASCLAAATTLALAACARPIARARRRPGHCAACGYDRRGLAPSAPCPECGAVAGA